MSTCFGCLELNLIILKIHVFLVVNLIVNWVLLVISLVFSHHRVFGMIRDETIRFCWKFCRHLRVINRARIKIGPHNTLVLYLLGKIQDKLWLRWHYYYFIISYYVYQEWRWRYWLRLKLWDKWHWSKWWSSSCLIGRWSFATLNSLLGVMLECSYLHGAKFVIIY